LSSLSGISKRAHSRRGLDLTKPGLALMQLQPHRSAFSAQPPDWHFCSISQET